MVEQWRFDEFLEFNQEMQVLWIAEGQAPAEEFLARPDVAPVWEEMQRRLRLSPDTRGRGADA